MTETRPTVSLRCYTRPTTLTAPVDETITTLRAATRTETIAELTIQGWPAEVPLDETSPHTDIVACYERFREWAAQRDACIHPPFAIRERTTLSSDTTEQMLVLPVFCLAIHRWALENRHPHETETRTITVADTLGVLDTPADPPAETIIHSLEPLSDPAPATDGVAD